MEENTSATNLHDGKAQSNPSTISVVVVFCFNSFYFEILKNVLVIKANPKGVLKRIGFK